MKKLIVTLLCAMFLCAMLQPVVFAVSDSIEIEVDGHQLTLLFDPSEQFSNVNGGNLQASFYTYLDDSNDLYELYMIFPVDVQSGVTLDPAYARQNASETSVVLIVTTKASADYYFAGQTDDTDATDYTIHFDSVTESGTGRTYSGTLSASMIGMAADDETELMSLSIRDARFSFTMPMDGEQPSEESPEETLPPDIEDAFDDNDYDSFAEPAPTREIYRV